eukprot:CAMPEP_0118961866 /NCGR_PEP_ID=MMETSP1173-20130426/410_1 /TAXON_ID=1034831 /ORGANISM="Rhizochromulina marina cf, Strain CCMP1243" /LENGTH=418 /DNA_ID=CAMNT_0006910061 /DNA_START=176 /DNA_END=1432 /DNA_ORIENTATION=+
MTVEEDVLFSIRKKYSYIRQRMMDAYGEEEGSEFFDSVTQDPTTHLEDRRALIKDLATAVQQHRTRALKPNGQYFPNDIVKNSLVHIYDALNGPEWSHQVPGWILRERFQPVKLWHGVTMENNILVAIKLVHNNMKGDVGHIFHKLGALESCASCQLKELNLASNDLNGSFDTPSIALLKSLVVLCLNFNKIEGKLPGAYLSECVNLAVLNLQGNNLVGQIPPELGQLTKLRILHLYSNKLEGPLPEELGNLTLLQELRLWDNQLTGPIPPSIANLKDLKVLHLGQNKLTGAVPGDIGELTSLEYLYLNDNLFSGKIPVAALVSLQHIRAISLSQNDFEEVDEAEAALKAVLINTEIIMANAGMLYMGTEFPEAEKGAVSSSSPWASFNFGTLLATDRGEAAGDLAAAASSLQAEESQ